jgi:hypothetical protein
MTRHGRKLGAVVFFALHNLLEKVASLAQADLLQAHWQIQSWPGGITETPNLMK